MRFAELPNRIQMEPKYEGGTKVVKVRVTPTEQGETYTVYTARSIDTWRWDDDLAGWSFTSRDRLPRW